MKFVIWGANLSGGFLRANVDQAQDAGIEYNEKLATLADHLGVDSILYPIRYVGNIGGTGSNTGQLDPLSIITAIATKTERIHLIAAVLPGFIHPATLAKIGATIDIISKGRFHINLVSGWFKAEQEMFGIEWIKHEERYRRSEEYLKVLKGLWTEDEFQFEGNFYNIQKGTLNPKPLQKPYPPIYQGGNSQESQIIAGTLSDYYFMNGAPLSELKEQIAAVQQYAANHQRYIKFAVAAFVIARPTEEEAQKEYEYILNNADQSAITHFKQRKETKGMWKNATTISDYVANNEGFRTGLIGSYEQVAQRLKELEAIGIEKVLVAFRHPTDELPTFFEHVVPKVNNDILLPNTK
ncbi:LLM class flavin-dependent oxidoreductase [Rummeliibacillus pycnus]|uniref:LLM class flavin-dependent oxidoreductase n=1 Tax=Rummeliibacillus pycnus TaxID=101070 RepID=UPI000C9B7693|nr:LLM class flavin-dependent oxidoreductase [Rummeliibacillus pycnus]